MHMRNSDSNVDMIYLDFFKAFDIEHGILLHTCRAGILIDITSRGYKMMLNNTQTINIQFMCQIVYNSLKSLTNWIIYLTW